MMKILLRGLLFLDCVVICIVVLWGVVSTLPEVHAASYLTYVSDTITDSAPASTTNQTLLFTLGTAIPPSGVIEIDFTDGAFDVPSALNFTDVDVGFSNTPGGPYTERPLASVATAGTDGVSVVSGTSSVITITLNSSVGLSADDQIQILIGTNASYGGAGDQQVTNVNATGSYPVVLTTYDDSMNELDYAATRVFLIEKVLAGPVDTTDEIPPTITFSEPSGIIQVNTPGAELLVGTNELAQCRYATSSGIDYDLMPVQFTATSGTFAALHTSVVTGFVSSTTYTYYVRCRDFRNNQNPDDYILEFTVGIVPGSASTTSTSTGTGTGSGPNASSTGTGTGTGTGDSGSGSGPGTSGSSGGGSGSGGDEGGQYLHLSDVEIDGYAYPNAEVTILLDNNEAATEVADDAGVFSNLIESLDRGTYTFSLYATDSDGTRSSTFTTTIALRSNTVNHLSNIMLPPTLIPVETSIDPGNQIEMNGYSVPLALVAVSLRQRAGVVSQTDVTATTTAAANGRWSLSMSTVGLNIGTYELVAEASMPDGSVESDKSFPRIIGIGQDVGDLAGDGLGADLSFDGFVNLVDFSILLFNWNTFDSLSDINDDGIVNLTDFSIMIYYWTG